MYKPTYLTPIIKLTCNCNYSCYFCRYANHRQRNSDMSVNDVKKIIDHVIEYNSKNKHKYAKFIFHGGEPLLWGIDRFKEIMSYQVEKSKTHSIKLINSIQTNGSLIDEEWAVFFRQFHFQVGISLDGPVSMNGHYGRIDSYASLVQVKNNIKLLEKNNVEYGILSVITNNHFGKAEEFYNYWIDNNIKNIGLSFCYNPKDEIVVELDELNVFLVELFDLYFHGKNELNIREFNNAIKKYYKKVKVACTSNCRENCGNFITIDHKGDVTFCDEYDLDKNNLVGNINRQSFEEIIISDKYQNIYRKSIRIISNRCIECEYLNICGAGCARNDINDGKENYFCRTYMTLYKHIQDTIESIR